MTPEQRAEFKRRSEAAFAAARERHKNQPKWRSLWVGETADGEQIHLSPFEPSSLRADIEVLMKAPSMPEWRREGLLFSIVGRIHRRGPLSLDRRHEVAADILRGLSEGVPSRVQPIEPFHRLRWSETTKARHPGGADVKWYPITEDQAAAHLRRVVKRMRSFDVRVRNVHVWVPRYRGAMEPYADRAILDQTAAWRLEIEDLVRLLGPGLSPREHDALLACINGARDPADLHRVLALPSRSAARELLHRLRKKRRGDL